MGLQAGGARPGTHSKFRNLEVMVRGGSRKEKAIHLIPSLKHSGLSAKDLIIRDLLILRTREVVDHLGHGEKYRTVRHGEW